MFINVVLDEVCTANDCVCTFKEEEFDGFAFDEDKHKFVSLCDDCGEPMQAVGVNGWLECSDNFTHPKQLLWAEDWPPFFDGSED